MDLETWVPSCGDKTSWPDGWWESRHFLECVVDGTIAKIDMASHFEITIDNVEAQHIVKILIQGSYKLPGSRGFEKRVRKQNITSFEDAWKILMTDYTRAADMLLPMTSQLYLLNSSDPRARAHALQDAVLIDPPRDEIEKELIRRAEIEDAC